MGYWADGTILDVSKSGLRVRVARPVTRGWKVQVTIGDSIVEGQVRYCVQSGEAYEFGVFVLDVAEGAR